MIYIAGPYSNPPELRKLRFEQLSRAAAEYVRAGHYVYCGIAHAHPIDLHLQDLQLTSDFWCALDRRFMAVCDRCVVIQLDGWECSSGVKQEVAWFKERSRPVEFVEPSRFVLTGER